LLVLFHTVLLLKSTLKLVPFHQLPFPPALSEEIATSTNRIPDTWSTAVPWIEAGLVFEYKLGELTDPVGAFTSYTTNRSDVNDDVDPPASQPRAFM
jgi:hypothetical protein